MSNPKAVRSMYLLTSFVLLGLAQCNGFNRNTAMATQTYNQSPASLTGIPLHSPTLSRTPIAITETKAVSLTATIKTLIGGNTPTPIHFLLSPSPVFVANCVDQASAGRPLDVTIPDDTEMKPGQDFSKAWRLINSGTCPWTAGYSVVWVSGEKMGTTATFPVGTTVQPGQEVDITADMVAPKSPGTYQSNWKLKNASGDIFGVGTGEGLYFYVRVRVVGTPVPQNTLAPAVTVTPTLAVLTHGPTRLLVNDRLDLDNNQLNPGKGADIALTTGGGKYLLIPMGRTTFGVFGKTEPSLMDCRTASLDARVIYIDDKTSGVYLCYRTDLGLPGWAQLTRFWPENKMLNLEIHTWDLP